MQGGVAGVELGITCGGNPELDEQLGPTAALLAAPGVHQQQRAEAVETGVLGRDAVVLRGPLDDALFEQRQEQVGLAGELGVHDPLREAGLLGDGIQPRTDVALLEEDRPGGFEDQLAVALDLLGPGHPECHTRDEIHYEAYSDRPS